MAGATLAPASVLADTVADSGGSDARRTAGGAPDAWRLPPILQPRLNGDWGIAMSMRTPNTRPIVVSGSDDATVRVWDLDSRGLVSEPLKGHKGTVNAVAVGKLHGRPIAVSGGNDRTVRLWDLDAGRSLRAPLEGHRRKVLAVAVGELRDRPIAVSGGNDNTVRVWDLRRGDRWERRWRATAARSWR